MSLGFRDINPALKYRYEVVVLGVAPRIISGGSFPFTVIESYSHLDQNSVSYFPGPNDVGDVELTIYETESGEAFKFFEDWFSEVVDDSGFYNLPSEFKRRVEAYRLNGLGERVFGLQYVGAWPKQITPYEPSAEDREAMTFTVTLSVDGVSKIL